MRNIILSLSVISLFISSCGPNVLSGLSSQSTDDYYLEEARKANNSQNYDYAIDVLVNKLSSGAQAISTTKELLASAYAGKCGFNFIDYVQKFSDNTTSAVFKVMMLPFVQVAADPSYCLLALQTMDTIGTPAQRTANENTFSAITGLVLMGISLRAYADKDSTNNNGDGEMDANNMICQAGLVTDDQMDDIILGYGYFVTNFSYVSASLLGSDSMDGLNSSIAVCNSIPSAKCDITKKSDITPETRGIIRMLLNTSTYGIGDEDGSNPIAIGSACPGH